MVKSLRNDDTGQWDFDILKDLFNQRDMDLILQLPLSHVTQPDRWLWFGDKKGSYSVKNGNRLLMENSEQITPYSSSVDWQSIWLLKVPAKVRITMWRALTGCLPTTTALRGRCVDVPLMCPTCSNGPEDVYHALVSCSFAKSLWQISSMGELSTTAGWLGGWWKILIQRCTKEELELAAMLIWNIWKHRNDRVWSNKRTPIGQILSSSISLLEQWQCAQGSSPTSPSVYRASGGLETWTKPPTGRLKCNFDAALFNRTGIIGFGCIVRNSHGHLVEAWNGVLVGTMDPAIAEAISCREALSWIKDHGINDIIVESDSQVLSNAINSSSMDSSYFGLLVFDCKVLVKELVNVSFEFVHVLARTAGSGTGRGRWASNLLSFLLDVLTVDQC